MRLTMEQLQGKIQRWMRIAPEKLKRALLKGAKIVTKEAQSKHLSGPKMPRGIGHPTRATLAVQTGRLRRSITERVTVSKDKVTAQVGTNVKYARLHEEGLEVRGRKMPERPFLRPSVDVKKPRVMELVLEGMMEGYNSG